MRRPSSLSAGAVHHSPCLVSFSSISLFIGILSSGDSAKDVPGTFVLEKNKKGAGYKPGYVGASLSAHLRPGAERGDNSSRPSFICGAALTASEAVYPPAMGEQPLNAGVLDLATHKTCGTPCCHDARWALTPPFHPCRLGGGGRSLSRCSAVADRRQINRYGALCCPDFPHA